MIPKQLLCVEDDEEDCAWIKEAANKVNPELVFVHKSDGRDALDYLWMLREEGVLPCLMLMDINMPKLNGRDTAVQIKTDPFLQAMPIVIFSTSSNSMDKIFFDKLDIEMITKPFSYPEFRERISEVVRKYCM
jgi:CheY-like chemotaxis protein